jgi:hypothetical protein
MKFFITAYWTICFGVLLMTVWVGVEGVDKQPRSDFMIPAVHEAEPECYCLTDTECMEKFGGDGYDGE